MTLRNAFADLSTEATLSALNDKLPAQVGGRMPVELPPGGGGLTDTELRAAPVPVLGQGELIEVLEALRMTIASLTRTVGMTLPDATGRARVNVETGSISVSALPTLAAVTTVATLTTLTNQAQSGGYAANDVIPALLNIGIGNLRNNILVT